MEQQNFIHELMDATDQKLTPKQAQIIQAAIEIFAEKGYAATSTSEIAKRAGVAEGTIFRHYKTKKDLLISIVSPAITRFVVPFFAEKFVQDVFDQDEIEEIEPLLKNLISNRYQFVKNNVPLLRIMLQEMAFHPELQEQYKRVFVSKVLPRFKQVVDQLRGARQIGDIPTETVLRLTMTTIIGFLITRFIVMPDYPWDDETEIEYTIQFIRNGLKGI
ncbi:TetR/AcrR family transcriptional regulator [Salinibacillus xinjiangensis]|uniref:TetR family transcriptional regulator n=1 Tax=Salinibacillus xinjiangensis TaxID=1229268 RepID=A0A6G1X9H4_9BACI|nr:TetR/AcrR family transcriptional regulator [Salinibacillus xinjiangensis]MRG87438.1 TetR family transcriptional regulator [Salinibacillus xinjiangensis]